MFQETLCCYNEDEPLFMMANNTKLKEFTIPLKLWAKKIRPKPETKF